MSEVKYKKIDTHNLLSINGLNSKLLAINERMSNEIYISYKDKIHIFNLYLICMHEIINGVINQNNELFLSSANVKFENENNISFNFNYDFFSLRLKKSHSDEKYNLLLKEITDYLSDNMEPLKVELEKDGYCLIIQRSDFYKFIELMTKYEFIYNDMKLILEENSTYFGASQLYGFLGGDTRTKIHINDLVKEVKTNINYIMEDITENQYKVKMRLRELL